MKFLVIALVLFFSGCATEYVNPYLDGKHSVAAGNTTESIQPVKCSDKADCDAKWGKSLAWVANNGRWKIQLSNDSIIQTYGPGNSINNAFTVIRQNNADGSGSIDIQVRCGNLFGCTPSVKDHERAFKNQF